MKGDLHCIVGWREINGTFLWSSRVTPISFLITEEGPTRISCSGETERTAGSSDSSSHSA